MDDWSIKWKCLSLYTYPKLTTELIQHSTPPNKSQQKKERKKENFNFLVPVA